MPVSTRRSQPENGKNFGYYGFCGKPVYISDDLKTAYLGRIESMKGTAPVIVPVGGKNKGRLKNSVIGFQTTLDGFWVSNTACVHTAHTLHADAQFCMLLR